MSHAKTRREDALPNSMRPKHVQRRKGLRFFLRVFASSRLHPSVPTEVGLRSSPPLKRECNDVLAGGICLDSSKLKASVALLFESQGNLLEEPGGTAHLLPRRLLRAPPMKDAVHDRATLHFRDLAVDHEVTGHVLVDGSHSFHIDADWRIVDGRSRDTAGV